MNIASKLLLTSLIFFHSSHIIAAEKSCWPDCWSNCWAGFVALICCQCCNTPVQSLSPAAAAYAAVPGAGAGAGAGAVNAAAVNANAQAHAALNAATDDATAVPGVVATMAAAGQTSIAEQLELPVLPPAPPATQAQQRRGTIAGPDVSAAAGAGAADQYLQQPPLSRAVSAAQAQARRGSTAVGQAAVAAGAGAQLNVPQQNHRRRTAPGGVRFAVADHAAAGVGAELLSSPDSDSSNDNHDTRDLDPGAIEAHRRLVRIVHAIPRVGSGDANLVPSDLRGAITSREGNLDRAEGFMEKAKHDRVVMLASVPTIRHTKKNPRSLADAFNANLMHAVAKEEREHRIATGALVTPEELERRALVQLAQEAQTPSPSVRPLTGGSVRHSSARSSVNGSDTSESVSNTERTDQGSPDSDAALGAGAGAGAGVVLPPLGQPAKLARGRSATA